MKTDGSTTYIGVLLAIVAAGCLLTAMLSFWWIDVVQPRGPQSLLRYQQSKLASEGARTEVMFLGDSSLGNAVNARLFSQVSGAHTLNLAMVGTAFGLSGNFGLLREILAAHRPRLVIFMHTPEILTQPPTLKGAWAMFMSPLPVVDRLRLAHAMLLGLLNASNARHAIEAIISGRQASNESQAELADWLENDYVRQAPPNATARSPGGAPTLRQVERTHGIFLRLIAAECARQEVVCVYMHGTISAEACSRSQAFFANAADLIVSSGLSLAERLPVCVPPDELGDSINHVLPSLKDRYTVVVFERLREWLGKDRASAR